MNLRIVFFMGKFQTIYAFNERFISAAKAKGIECYVADASIKESYCCQEFFDFIEKPGTVMFTINSFGVKLFGSDGINTWKRYNVPVYEFIVDNPSNFDDVLSDPPCELHLFCHDRNYAAYARRFYPKLSSVHFLPHGGITVNSSVSYRDRTIDVLYTGGVSARVKYYPPISVFPDGGSDFYNSTINMLVNDPMKTTEEAIEEYLRINGYEYDDSSLFKLITEYSNYIENTVKRYFKIEGVKALSDMGINVEIYGGDSWRDEDCIFGDSIKVYDFVSYKDLFSIIAKAKIVLCFIPWLKDGGSQKNFDAHLSGALCVSDRSKYLGERYIDGDNIVYFDLNNPKQMAADVKWLLEHPEVSEVIAERGYQTALQNDTWEKRFDEIYKVMIETTAQREQ